MKFISIYCFSIFQIFLLLSAVQSQMTSTVHSFVTEILETSTSHQPGSNTTSPNSTSTESSITTTTTRLPTTLTTTTIAASTSTTTTSKMTTPFSTSVTTLAISTSKPGSTTTAKYVPPIPGAGIDPGPLPVIKTKRRFNDCGELLLAGYKTTGTYKIYPTKGQTQGVYVKCDMDTDGGGWTTVFSKGVQGVQRESFDLKSTSYVDGFGSTCGDLWIGLKVLAALTSRNDQQVRISSNWYNWAHHYHGWWFDVIDVVGYYRYFQIVNISGNYQFRLSVFQTGSSGDQSPVLNGSQFLSKDTWGTKNCTSAGFSGPGWYKGCTLNYNLNVLLQNHVQGGVGYNEMKIRNPFLKWNTTLSDATKNFERFGRIPKDCLEILLSRSKTSGVYKIYPDQTTTFVYVYCDMTTDGGGWTTILQRGKFTTDREDLTEYRWDDYVNGFGSTCGDLMMGLGTLHTLVSSQDQSLRIDLTDWESRTVYATYSSFWIKDSDEAFQLQIRGYSGNAGDSLSPHNGMSFTTYDRDNDLWNGNCAERFGGGWWYANCLYANLNGEYLNTSEFAYGHGIVWSTWKGFNYSIKTVEMRIRNVNFSKLRDLYATV